MNYLPIILYVTLLFHSVLGFLPAPVNISVDSLNFHHVLRWDPGPGTPPRTLYKIYKRVDKKRELLNSTNTTSLELLLDSYEQCHLTVQAFYNRTLSSPESKIRFTPFRNTIIGPAELSLHGCGDCIQINISMPEPDRRSGVEDLQKFYDPLFTVWWRKEKEAVSDSKTIETHSKRFTLDKLETGEKYCVKVYTKIRTNVNTVPSTWKCTFTSAVELRRDSAVLGAVATSLIVIIGVVMISTFCLYYTGFLCKLQETLPRALITALRQGYTLTPEKTFPDLMSVTSETEKRRIHNNSTTPHAATRYANSEEEEDEEEEEGINAYVDRNAELSSGESSCSGTNVFGNSGSLKEMSSTQVEAPPAEFETEVVQGELDQNEAKAEGAAVSFMPKEGQTEVQGHISGEQENGEMKEKVEMCDSSGNVNLFSVTLSALTVGVEEKQNTKDSCKLHELETLLATVSKLTFNNADSQMTDYQITVASEHPTHEDLTKTGYEGRHAEEEEEEQFSGYMAHT